MVPLLLCVCWVRERALFNVQAKFGRIMQQWMQCFNVHHTHKICQYLHLKKITKTKLKMFFCCCYLVVKLLWRNLYLCEWHHSPLLGYREAFFGKHFGPLLEIILWSHPQPKCMVLGHVVGNG